MDIQREHWRGAIALKLELYADEVTTVPPPAPLFVSSKGSFVPPKAREGCLSSLSVRVFRGNERRLNSRFSSLSSSPFKVLAPRLGYLPQISQQALAHFEVRLQAHAATPQNATHSRLLESAVFDET